jgi:ribonuclease HI
MFSSTDMDVIIFTDGSSRGNPGPGGWGAILIIRPNGDKDGSGEDTTVVELGSREKMTTNNRMEMTAAIQALKKTPKEATVEIRTDSKYLIDGITKWVASWKRNGWKTYTRKDVLNKDLWMELDALVAGRTIRWRYVGGHIGVVGNERCDEIATSFADGADVDLYDGKLEKYRVRNVL